MCPFTMTQMTGTQPVAKLRQDRDCVILDPEVLDPVISDPVILDPVILDRVTLDDREQQFDPDQFDPDQTDQADQADQATFGRTTPDRNVPAAASVCGACAEFLPLGLTPTAGTCLLHIVPVQIWDHACSQYYSPQPLEGADSDDEF